MERRLLLTLAIGVLALGLAACGQSTGGGGTAAADYPRRNISVIVPAPAGGPLDVAARAVQPCLEDQLGQEVLVENKPGGSGTIGITQMVGSKADGYTLSTISSGSTVIQPLTGKDIAYDKDDYTPIGIVTEIPSVLIVRADAPWATAQDLIDAVKAAPGTVTLATPGAGTALQIGAAALADAYGIEFRTVPFNGHPELMRALLGGNADVAFDVATPDVLEQVEAGELRLLATSAAEPKDFLPDAVPFTELGLTDLPSTATMFGLATPAGVPTEIVDTLAGTVETCLQEDAVREALGPHYVPDPFMGPDDTRTLVDQLTSDYQPYLAAS